MFDYDSPYSPAVISDVIHLPLLPSEVRSRHMETELSKAVCDAIFDEKSYFYEDRDKGKVNILPLLNGEDDSHCHYRAVDEFNLMDLIRTAKDVEEHGHYDVKICVSMRSREIESLLHKQSHFYSYPSFNPLMASSILPEKLQPLRTHDSSMIRTIGYLDKWEVCAASYVPNGYIAAIDFGEQHRRPLGMRYDTERGVFGIAPVRRNMISCLAYNSDEYYYVSEE